MNERQKKIVKNRNLKESDFAPSTEDVTIADLVELVGVLTDIVLGGEDDE